MRVCCAASGVLIALLALVASAPAASQTVTATSFDTFSPQAVTVNTGEMVTWSNAGMFHNVHFDDGSFDQPPEPVSDPWSVSRTFTSPGSFRYYCEAHGGPGGSGMSGTVTVQAPNTVPAPGPMQPQPVAADRTAPALTFSSLRRQKVLRLRAVLVDVAVNEASTVVARGTISVPGPSRVIRTRKSSRRLAPGETARLKLRLSRAKLRAVRRALTRRSRLTARVTVTAADPTGNSRSAKRRITLRR